MLVASDAVLDFSLKGAARFSQLWWVVLSINTVLEPGIMISAFRLKYNGDQCHPTREKGRLRVLKLMLRGTQSKLPSGCRIQRRGLEPLAMGSAGGSCCSCFLLRWEVMGITIPGTEMCCRTVELRCSAQVLHLSVGLKSPHLLQDCCMMAPPKEPT